jgi:hypothetical protein
MNYSQQTLEAIGDRELDAILAQTVFGWKWFHRINDTPGCTWLLEPTTALNDRNQVPVGPFEVVNAPSWPLARISEKFDGPEYCTSWKGFGLVIERMHVMGWTYDVDATAPECGIDVSFHPKNPAFRAKGVGPTLPRATAIAALLAIQGAA